MEINTQTQLSAQYATEEGMPVVFFNAQINDKVTSSINISIVNLEQYQKNRNRIMEELARFEEQVFNEIK